MARIVRIGEGMLELSHPAADWQLANGGDALNAAIHLARAGHDVAFLSALGTDPMSLAAKAVWRADGVDTSLVLGHPKRHIGLYAVATDARGAQLHLLARRKCRTRHVRPALERKGMGCRGRRRPHFLFFGQPCHPAALGRARLLDLASAMRARSGRVACDSNYRPQLWRGEENALAAREAAIACADLGLPTLDDETALTGEGDPGGVAALWAELGCAETVVKLGAAGCRIPGGKIVAPDRALDPVDISGAGDAFNAGYLAARLQGADLAAAAAAGNALTARTTCFPGAIPPRA